MRARGRAPRVVHALRGGPHAQHGSMVDLEERVPGLLRDIAYVVRDFEPMQQRVREMIELARAAEGCPAELVGEVERFLDWLLQLNFVPLGFREYEAARHPGGSRDPCGAGERAPRILSDVEQSTFSG